MQARLVRAILAALALVALADLAFAQVRVEFANRPTLKVGTSMRASLRTKLQTDVGSSESTREEFAFDLAKRRIGVDVALFDRVSFELDREIGSRIPWRDVFADVRIGRPLQVQVGRFKVPFSAEQLTSIVDLPFIDRSMAAETLAPGRDTGIMIHGRAAGRWLDYQVGLFRQDGDTARRGDREGAGRTAAARFTTHAGVKHLKIGASATRGSVPDGLNSLPGRTPAGFRFFEPVYVKGRRLRVGAEAAWHQERYQLDAEWLQLRDQRRGQGLADADLSDAVATGWYASGAWTAVRGKRRHARTKQDSPAPSGRRRFFDRGAGDFEIAARVEEIAFGSAGRGDLPFRQPRAEYLFENQVRIATVGLNWHINRWIKVLTNLNRESFSDPERRPDPNRDHHWRWGLRLQWAM
ncbi:MAG: hypothetical protein HY654_04770 [Acidobacteria bacterium]|nr:hypothetical protein [Acidobacteriota bacterium]